VTDQWNRAVADRLDALGLAMGGVFDGDEQRATGELPLPAQARIVGAYQWIERRLFEVLGSWVASESVAEAQIMFDIYSQQHAWHAELFAGCLPALDSIDPNSLTVPPSAEIDRMLLSLAGGTVVDSGASAENHNLGSGAPAGGTLLRLVGVGRVVLARTVAGYALHLRRAATVSQASLRRCLLLVLRDETEQWQAIEALIQMLLRRPHDVAVVTAHQQRLEEMVAGGGAGLVPWPDPQPPG
jgi:hypothetical protein